MFAFVIRRILVSIPVLIGSSFLTFIIVKLSGDPLQSLKLRNPRPPAEVIANREHELWLDRSWPQQYWHWITNIVLHWNFGISVQVNEDIRSDLFTSMLVTLRLVAAAILLALVFAVITGVVSAVKQYTLVDHSTTFLGFLFLSMPVFWFAAILKEGGIWYNRHVAGHEFFATIGDRSIDQTNTSTWGTISDILGHLILPTIVLALASYAAWSRFTRASMLEVLGSDYIRLARSKGITSRRVLIRHALRTALIPLATVTALDVAVLLGGAIITETVFGWFGMGRLFVDSLANNQQDPVMAYIVIVGVLAVIANFVSDLIYAVLDPRIRVAA
jgi:peptide/nickel transport system permease protein